MANTSAILSHLDSAPRPPVTYSYLVPNQKGLEAFLAAPATPIESAHESEIAVFAAASEGFSRKNINCSIEESIERFRPVVEKALSEGIKVRGYVSMVISCPYDGPTPPELVGDVVEALLDMGCYEVSLGDTNGVGTPGNHCISFFI
jgi:hydroxymethylglutaryl-CoA lyase